MAMKPERGRSRPASGERNNRLDAFVGAAFAFAFAATLSVISTDRIPDAVDERLPALKTVPAFAASFGVVTLFWYAHVRWSRRYRMHAMLPAWPVGADGLGRCTGQALGGTQAACSRRRKRCA